MILPGFIAVPLLAITFTVMPRQSSAQPAASDWSAHVEGLAGRMRVAFEDLHPGLRVAVYVELRNVTQRALAVSTQPRIAATLRDADGRSLPSSGFPISGPLPSPRWAVIPPDAYAGFRVDMPITGLPAGEPRTALLAIGEQAWALPAGRYELSMTIVSAAGVPAGTAAPEKPWGAELPLAPVQFTVTARMLRSR